MTGIGAVALAVVAAGAFVHRDEIIGKFRGESRVPLDHRVFEQIPERNRGVTPRANSHSEEYPVMLDGTIIPEEYDGPKLKEEVLKDGRKVYTFELDGEYGIHLEDGDAAHILGKGYKGDRLKLVEPIHKTKKPAPYEKLDKPKTLPRMPVPTMPVPKKQQRYILARYG